MKRYRDTGLFSVNAGVEHKHLASCLGVVLKELHRVRKDPVSPKEFGQTVEYLTGQVLFALEDTMEHMCWMGESEMLLGRIEPVEVLLGQVAQVRRQDLTRAARLLIRPEHLSLAVIGPVKPPLRRRVERLLAA